MHHVMEEVCQSRDKAVRKLSQDSKLFEISRYLYNTLTTNQNYYILVTMSRIIALSPNKMTKKRPYKSPKRLAAKRALLAKKASKKGKKK